MAFTKGNWEDLFIDNGTSYDYKIFATFIAADAANFYAYWSNTLTQTTTANCTIVSDGTTITITEPAVQMTDDVHVEVIDDIKTTEDALVARTTAIASEYTAIAAYAATKITLAAHV